MTYISNFETSATVSERMREEDHRFPGRVGAGGVAYFSFVNELSVAPLSSSRRCSCAARK